MSDEVYEAWEKETFLHLASVSHDLAYSFMTVPYDRSDEVPERRQTQLAFLKAIRTGILTGDVNMAAAELDAGLPDGFWDGP